VRAKKRQPRFFSLAPLSCCPEPVLANRGCLLGVELKQTNSMMGALTLRLFFLVLYLLGDDGSKTLEAAPSGVAWCEKRHLFWSFPYVCPEPVLAKQSFGAKMLFFSSRQNDRFYI
jgi:hypothetical protein